MFVRNNLGKAPPCCGGSLVLWRRWAVTHRSDSGVLSSCGDHYALPLSPGFLSCSCRICVSVMSVLKAVGLSSSSTWGGSQGRHRGVAQHTLGACPCCKLMVSAVLGAKLLHPARVKCDCKCFLFLSYVSWCYGVFISLVTKPKYDVFIVTDEYLWTMQWFILQPLLLSDMKLSLWFSSWTLMQVCINNIAKRIVPKLGNSCILWANVAKSAFVRLNPWINHLIVQSFHMLKKKLIGYGSVEKQSPSNWNTDLFNQFVCDNTGPGQISTFWWESSWFE